MARYLKDITAPFDRVLPCNRPALNAWARASIEARQALASAAGRPAAPWRRRAAA